MDKLSKVRAEIEKLNAQLLRGACSSQIAMETYCKEEAYNEVLAILDTMQEKPASEDLEDAIEEAKDRAIRDIAWKIHVMISKGKGISEIDRYVCNICNF